MAGITSKATRPGNVNPGACRRASAECARLWIGRHWGREVVETGAQDPLLLGKPKDLALEGFTIRPRLGAYGLPLGARFVSYGLKLDAYGLSLDARFVSYGLKLDAYGLSLDARFVSCGLKLGTYGLPVGARFIACGLDLAAHTGNAGEGERGQGDAYPKDGKGFLTESGHVGHVGTWHDDRL